MNPSTSQNRGVALCFQDEITFGRQTARGSVAKGGMISMDNPHKQVVTTYPVAIRMGQGRVHVQHPIPWHYQSDAVQCPECEAVFIASEGFAEVKLFAELKKHHADHQDHPDMIPLEPTWTKIAECNCGM
jgi:hypothetical protein